jgi:hypothetical protein
VKSNDHGATSAHFSYAGKSNRASGFFFPASSVNLMLYPFFGNSAEDEPRTDAVRGLINSGAAPNVGAVLPRAP